MGVAQDKQKSGIIDAINKAMRQSKNKPIMVSFDNINFPGITSAKKYLNNNLNSYSDIVLSPKNSKDIYVSLKTQNLESSSENNFREIDSILPGMSSRFLKLAFEKLIDMGLETGNPVPEIYGKISDNMKEDVVTGTKTVGGPIDYVYENGSNIKSSYDEETGVLKLNGYLISSKQYSKSRTFFLSLKPKREDQKFDAELKYGGIPRIYGKSSRGDDNVIIEITEQAPKNAIIIKV